MWRLIQDFFRQNWVIRGVIAVGWLCMLIMLTSAYVSIADFMKSPAVEQQEQTDSEDSLSQ